MALLVAGLAAGAPSAAAGSASVVSPQTPVVASAMIGVGVRALAPPPTARAGDCCMGWVYVSVKADKMAGSRDSQSKTLTPMFKVLTSIHLHILSGLIQLPAQTPHPVKSNNCSFDIMLIPSVLSLKIIWTLDSPENL